MPETRRYAEERLIAFSTKWCARLLGQHSGAEQPSSRQLARLLTVLYHASLTTEEGRYPRLAAMWLGRKSPKGSLNVLALGKRKKLNEPRSTRPHADLLKTASICDSETVFLLVEAKRKGGLDLVAWGFGDVRGCDGSRGEKIREQLDISQYPNDVWTVHFSAPGRLSIRHGGKFIAEYPGADNTDLAGLWELGDRVGWSSRWANRAGGGSGCKLEEVRIYLLELVIGRLAVSGRGGILLWGGSRRAKHLDAGTSVESCSVDRQIRELIENTTATGVERDAPYRLRELAGWVSDVASVDGATELTASLDITMYGAKITAKDEELVARICETETYEWLKPRGTRHRSAAQWVVAEGAERPLPGEEGMPLALVVSADGEANAIFWEGGLVRRLPVVYRRL